MKVDRTTPGHLAALLTIFIWGTTFISTKILLKDFQPIEILLFRFLLGGGGVVLGLPQENEGNLPETGADVGCRWIVRNLLVLSAGKHRPYVYHGVQCGVILSVAPFLAAILTHWFLRGEEKTAAPFLFRFSGGDRGESA